MKRKKTKCFVAGVLVAALTTVSFLPRLDISHDALLAKYAGIRVVFADSYQPDIDKAKKYLEELEARQQDAKERLAELEASKDDLTAYIEQLDNEQAYAYEELMKLENDIAECEQLLETTGQELEEAKQCAEDQYSTMKARIKYLYENDESSIMDLFTQADSLSDVLNQVEYRSKISEYDASLFERYEETVQMVKQKEDEYRVLLADLNGAKALQEAELENLNALMTAKAAEMDRLTAQLGISEELYFEYFDEITAQKVTIEELEEKEAKRIEEEKRKAEEERKRREEEERKRKEEEERKKREEEQKKQQQAQQNVVRTDETDIDNMIWPFPGDGNVYSYFGGRISPISGKWESHSGWDIGGAYGADIVAVLAGKVTKATSSAANGLHVVIDHGNGVTTHYLHASKLLVSAGDYVQQGQVIMKCGSTGWSTGPHLHFTIRINGVAVDPGLYIKYK